MISDSMPVSRLPVGSSTSTISGLFICARRSRPAVVRRRIIRWPVIHSVTEPPIKQSRARCSDSACGRHSTCAGSWTFSSASSPVIDDTPETQSPLAPSKFR